MENTQKVKNRRLMSLALLFVSALQMGGMGLMPSLAAIQAEFPDTPTTIIQTIASFPGFIMIFGAVLSTWMSAKFSKKVLCMFGVACSASIGILGYLFNDSVAILYLWGGVLGLGFGFLMPTTNGIIADHYDEAGRSKLLGIQDLFTNGGGIYLTYVGGALAAIHWNLNYLAYLIGVIPFVLGCLFLPSDDPKLRPKTDAKEHYKINPKTWMYGIFLFLFINAYNVFGGNVSFVVVERGLGSPAVIGTAMSMFLVGGMIGGVLFIPVDKKLHDYTLCAAFLFLTAGYLIMYYSVSLLMVYFGAVIAGISIGLAMPESLVCCTNCNTIVAATAGCAVAHICGQLGTVCSAFFFTPVSALFSDAADFRYLFAAICCAIFALIIGITIKIVNSRERAKA